MTKRVRDLLSHLADHSHEEWYQWCTGGPMYGGVKQPELTPAQYSAVGRFDKKRAQKRLLPKVSGVRAQKKSRKSKQGRLM